MDKSSLREWQKKTKKSHKAERVGCTASASQIPGWLISGIFEIESASWAWDPRSFIGPLPWKDLAWFNACSCHPEILNNFIFEIMFWKWSLVGQWSMRESKVDYTQCESLFLAASFTWSVCDAPWASEHPCCVRVKCGSKSV